MSRLLVAQRALTVPGWAKDALWRRARAVPSLDLRFADNKSLVDATTGASLVTFTRASSGTFVGSDGVLQTAATDVPRFDHNPVTGESLGLLVEEQRTNLLLRSEEFETTWTTTRASVSSDLIASPSGTTTADKLVEDTTATSTHFVQQSVSVTTGTAYAFSLFAKAGERNFVQLVLNAQFATVISAIFDLSTGAVGITTGTPVTSAVLLSDGWWRLSITATANATGSTLAQVRVSNFSTTATYTGDGTSGIYIWGAQLEAGSFPTSYIPTTTAAVTRNADVASITGSAFSGWYRQDEGTVFSEGTLLTTPALPGPVVVLRDPTAASRHQVLLNSAAIVANAVVQASFSAAYTAQTKSGFAYALNNAAFVSNLTALQTDTTCLMPSGIVAATIGKFDFGGGQSHNGCIKRITYWPQRLANSTLQQITQ